MTILVMGTSFQCKHDFCWVCLEPWKWHNSTTGGFFRCTRYEVVEKVDEQLKSEVSDASDKHKALQELNRFVHYYSRYENHKHSLEVSCSAGKYCDGSALSTSTLSTCSQKLFLINLQEPSCVFPIKSKNQMTRSRHWRNQKLEMCPLNAIVDDSYETKDYILMTKSHPVLSTIAAKALFISQCCYVLYLQHIFLI